MDFSWAEPYPELYKICNLFNLYEISNPVRYKYTPIQGVLQEGPQCGLVALAMCDANPSKQLVNEIMRNAKDRGFTFNGEMFSARYMYELAKSCLKNKLVSLYSGPINTNVIREFIFDGGLVLIPYDCDKNHTPSCMNGRKAHWAVLNGIVETGNGSIYVLARHGKSRNVAVWDLNELEISNSQLNEYPTDSSLEYKIPDAGLDSPDGLKNKAVLISNKID